jgi:cephalosporin hydroxylase
MAISDKYHVFYEKHRLWEDNLWLGIPIYKNPMDLLVIQEIIFKHSPDLIIETGTGRGGSALFYASLFELMGSNGKVITIDIHQTSEMQNAFSKVSFSLKNRIAFIFGSSTNALVYEKVKALTKGKKVMVFLDSWHSEDHVFEEMNLYGDLVSVGQYLIVEDSHIWHPVPWEYEDKGPMGAIDRFLAVNDNFEIDENCERQIFTFNPRGHLRRIK